MLQAFDYEGPCLVLEAAERTLRQRIDASAIERTTVPTYMKAILEALQELHRFRLVHMDIKPANVFQVGGSSNVLAIGHCSPRSIE